MVFAFEYQLAISLARSQLRHGKRGLGEKTAAAVKAEALAQSTAIRCVPVYTRITIDDYVILREEPRKREDDRYGRAPRSPCTNANQTGMHRPGTSLTVRSFHEGILIDRLITIRKT